MKDKSNVVFLNGICEVVTGNSVDEVIRFCESTLRKAERGEIVGIAIATVNPSGSIGTGWRLGLASDTNMTMAGQRLAHRLMARWAD